MPHNCERLQQGSQPVISIKTRVPVQELPRALGSAFQTLEEYLREVGEAPVGPPYVAYTNMDMTNLEIEIGFPVTKQLPDREPVQAGEIPAGQIATCLYTGPYTAMKTAYDELTAWVNEHGYQPTGVSYEYYLNDPETTAPEDLQTRIVFPLA